jgi:sensor histidine kinase YesM
MFKRLRFHYKLFIFVSFFTFVILLASGFIFYFYTVSIINKNISENQKQTTQKLQEQLDSILDEMDRVSIAINSSQYIMDVLMNTPENTEDNFFDMNPKINSDVKNALFSYLLTKTINGRISLISKNYDYISLNNKFGNRQVTKEYIRSVTYIAELMASNQYKMYLPPHIDYWSTGNEMVFSLARPLRDSYGIYGLVEVSRDITEIDNIFSSKDISQSINICIFDDMENLIYSNFDENIGIDGNLLYNDEIGTSDFGSYTVNINRGGKLIASYSKLSNVNWTIVQFEDIEAYIKPISVLGRIILISYIFAFIFLLVMIYFLTGSLTKPIKRLKESIVSIDTKNLKIEFESEITNNEISLLGEAFQNLLNNVKDNANLILQSKEREVKAHMLALQTQMNPHFLYNTLSVIGAYGQQKGNVEVAVMCADLAQMLRYAIDFADNAVDIGMEIEQAKIYLKLMSNRFEGYLKYDINIDPQILGIKVPKLILEPIIENAFQHGFRDVEPPWKLNIDGYIENSSWYIRVFNIGRRFDDDAMKDIQQKLDEVRKGSYSQPYSSDISRGGLGLVNAFIRMNIFYKGKEHISFSNTLDAGVEIIIGGPIQKYDGGQDV